MKSPNRDIKVSHVDSSLGAVLLNFPGTMSIFENIENMLLVTILWNECSSGCCERGILQKPAPLCVSPHGSKSESKP